MPERRGETADADAVREPLPAAVPAREAGAGQGASWAAPNAAVESAARAPAGAHLAWVLAAAAGLASVSNTSVAQAAQQAAPAQQTQQQAPVQPAQPAQPVPAQPTSGLFPELTITDRTATYGSLATNRPMTSAQTANVVLHQTGASQNSTLGTYGQRVKQNSHIGAQYLIDDNGEISLITPTDRVVHHVGPSKLPGQVSNANSIGIEHVGTSAPITKAGPPPAATASKQDKDAWAAEMTRVRADIAALDLSPPLKERLLDPDLSDRKLYRIMKDNEWRIYGDITGPQKRSSMLLTRELREEYSLDLDDVRAHEDVSSKTIGEGANIRDAHVAMDEYRLNVAMVATLTKQRADLQRNATLTEVVAHESALVDALGADATAAENAALAAKTGAASDRERSRAAFYDDFWARTRQVADLLAFLTGERSTDAVALAELLRDWRR